MWNKRFVSATTSSVTVPTSHDLCCFSYRLSMINESLYYMCVEQCCIRQLALVYLLYMMHSNNNNNYIYKSYKCQSRHTIFFSTIGTFPDLLPFYFNGPGVRVPKNTRLPTILAIMWDHTLALTVPKIYIGYTIYMCKELWC